MTTTDVYVMEMLLLIGMGFFCACKLNCDNPLWVRLIALAPSLAAMFSLWMGGLPTQLSTVVVAGATVLVYVFVLAALFGKPLLQIRSKNEAV
jgi:hypothetical protein